MLSGSRLLFSGRGSGAQWRPESSCAPAPTSVPDVPVVRFRRETAVAQGYRSRAHGDAQHIEAREADPEPGFVARTMVLCAPESTERRAALMGSTVCVILQIGVDSFANDLGG